MLHLSAGDRQMLAGEQGPAVKLALELVVRTAEIGAEEKVIGKKKKKRVKREQ
jgi:predicted aconitase